MLTLYIKYIISVTKIKLPVSGDNSNPFGLSGCIICRHMARFPQHFELFNIITSLVGEVFAPSNSPFHFYQISANSFLKFKTDKRPCPLHINHGPFLVILGLRGSSSPSSYFTSLVSLCFIFLRSFFPCFEYSFKSSLLTCSKKSKKRMKGLEGWTKKEKQEFWGSSTFNLSSLSVDGQKWMDILERLTGGKKLLGGERVLERFQEKRHCWRKEPISTSSFFL